jgi:hypothetical protein
MIDFSNVGTSVSKDSSAFKKIQKFSKITNNNLTRDISNNMNSLKKIDNLYLNTHTLANNSYHYGNSNQNAYSSLKAVLPYSTTLLDNKSLHKFFEYSLSQDTTRLSQLGSDNNFSSKNNNLNTSILHNIHSGSTLDFFTLRKLFYSINEFSINSFFNNKDKSNIFNFINKVDIYTRGNKLTQTSFYKNMLDELITENKNTFYS